MILPKIGSGVSAILTDPVQCAALRIQNGLQLWLGNWKLDQSQGFPWQQILANKNPNLVAASNKLKSAILLLGAPVVISVPSVQMAFNTTIRNLVYAFTALAATGQQIIGGSNGPAGLPFVVVN
ncbi:MAG TPA: hypothetical protein VN894_12705 [Polyangiaceae bacterium]|nr:hypothetical protein [Polyangiaceae bacterium]